MTEPVKPCPMCGGEASWREKTVSVDDQGYPDIRWYVQCDDEDCAVMTGVLSHIPGSAEDLWNRRATGQTEREATEPDTTLFGLELRYSSYLPADGLYVNPEYLKVPARSLASTPPEKKP